MMRRREHVAEDRDRAIFVGSSFGGFLSTNFALAHPDRISGAVMYSTDLFERGTAERMAEHYADLLARLVERPDAPLSSVPLAGPAERAGLLAACGAALRSLQLPETGGLPTQVMVTIDLDGTGPGTHRDVHPGGPGHEHRQQQRPT